MQHFNPFSMLDRRQFLTAATSTVGVATLGTVNAQDSDLRLRAGQQDLFRVRMDVEMKGNVNVPSNPLAARKQVLKLPIESTALFDYEERLHRAKRSDSQSNSIRAAERYYHRATANSTLNQNSQIHEEAPPAPAAGRIANDAPFEVQVLPAATVQASALPHLLFRDLLQRLV